MIDLFNPIFTFLLVLTIVIILYLFAGTLEPPLKKTKYKLKSYYCGEASPPGKAHQSYDFFHVAFFFTILHVGALLLATAPSDQGAILGVILIAVMGLTAFALYVGGRNHA